MFVEKLPVTREILPEIAKIPGFFIARFVVEKFINGKHQKTLKCYKISP